MRVAVFRSWIIAALATMGGLFLWLLDDVIEGVRTGWVHEAVEVVEFIIFVPGFAISSFSIAEALRYRSERLANERRRAQRERLLALGAMAAGVAHEVRNPLHTIRLILDELQALGQLGDYYDKLLRHLRRIDRTVAFACQVIDQDSTTQAADYGEIVSAVLADESGEPPHLVHTIPLKVLVKANGDGVSLIVVNLLRNAMTAAGIAGTVQVELVVQAGVAVLSIRNPGILPEGFDLAQPSSPSSTLGLGLGLFISHQVAVSMGAELTVVQHGTTVEARLALPLATTA